jgi:hypothetical protein
MDAERFDTLTRSLVAASTRRRFLRGVSSVFGAGVPLALAGTAVARKKRKRKRSHAPRCPLGRIACNGHCGMAEGASCDGHGACCSNFCIFGRCSLTCMGKPCTQDADCCANVPCFATALGSTCGGCLGPARGGCGDGARCCYSECDNGVCGSRVGERCVTELDCSGGEPCVGRKCACPTQCCLDTDCAPAETCRGGECQPSIGG